MSLISQVLPKRQLCVTTACPSNIKTACSYYKSCRLFSITRPWRVDCGVCFAANDSGQTSDEPERLGHPHDGDREPTDNQPSTSGCPFEPTDMIAGRAVGGGDTGSGEDLDMQALVAAMQRERALERYREELANPKPDLLRCAMYIASAEYPELDMEACAAEIDRLAALVEAALPPAGQRYPLRVVQAISNVLYTQEGFCGNQVSYYEPENSYINKVLERRTGIPISLSLVYMEVARRVGMPMVGVNIPAHFMIRPDVEGVEVLVDAFQQGEVKYLEEAQELVSGLVGMDVRLDPKFVHGTYTLPARTFLMRMLNNIKQLYVASNDVESALRIVRFMRATDPDHAPEVRDEGLCLYALKRYNECAASLTQYLQMAPGADDASMVYALLAKVKGSI